MSGRDLEELAALDAVGILDQPSQDAYLERLARASEAERRAIAEIYDAAASLPAGLTPIDPPPALRERILARVTAVLAPAPTLLPATFSMRASERAWQATPVPGVEVTTLYRDAERNAVTLLLRMAAGSVYPAHHHSGAEECYVISGDVTITGERLTAGDFHHASTGSHHGSVATEHGAEVLLVVAASDYNL